MQIEISDLYLAAYLLSNGMKLITVHHTSNRSNLVLSGSEIQKLRRQYDKGSVLIDIRKLKKNYNRVRSAIKGAYPTERTEICQNYQKALSKV